MKTLICFVYLSVLSVGHSLKTEESKIRLFFPERNLNKKPGEVKANLERSFLGPNQQFKPKKIHEEKLKDTFEIEKKGKLRPKLSEFSSESLPKKQFGKVEQEDLEKSIQNQVVKALVQESFVGRIRTGLPARPKKKKPANIKVKDNNHADFNKTSDFILFKKAYAKVNDDSEEKKKRVQILNPGFLQPKKVEMTAENLTTKFDHVLHKVKSLDVTKQSLLEVSGFRDKLLTAEEHLRSKLLQYIGKENKELLVPRFQASASQKPVEHQNPVQPLSTLQRVNFNEKPEHQKPLQHVEQKPLNQRPVRTKPLFKKPVLQNAVNVNDRQAVSLTETNVPRRPQRFQNFQKNNQASQDRQAIPVRQASQVRQTSQTVQNNLPTLRRNLQTQSRSQLNGSLGTNGKIQGFRVKGDRSGKVIFLDISNFGLSAPPQSLKIGDNELVPV